MITKAVAVSGTVGKQVFASTVPVVLKGYSIYCPTSAATVTIRDGNASGEILHEGQSPLDDSREFCFKEGIRFDKGMHVKVLGIGSSAYLYIN